MVPYITHIKFQNFTNWFWQFLFLSHIADMLYSIDLFMFLGKTVKKEGVMCNLRKIQSFVYTYPCFSYFSICPLLMGTPLTFIFISSPKLWLIQLAVSPKCLLSTPVWHPVQKMAHFKVKSATFRQKTWDYLIVNYFRLPHGGTSGIISGPYPIRGNFLFQKNIWLLLM
jgi:hypothetical protein